MQKISNKICGSGDAFVGYIYNELPSAERLAFEDHLLDCTSCTDEFAAIADSRYAVYEWQKLEFEPMETPHFANAWSADTPVRMSAEHEKPLPTKSVNYQPIYAAVAAMLQTRVSALRESLSYAAEAATLRTRVSALHPRLATAGAFGLLIVAVGFAAIFISSGPTEVVSTGGIQVIDTFPEPPAKTAENTPVSVPKSVEPEERVRPEFATVKKPAPKVAKKGKRTAPRPQNIGNETQAKAPRLNDFEDLSDDSLRLADLVADVDTRD